MTAIKTITIESMSAYVHQAEKVEVSMGEMLIIDQVAEYLKTHCYPLRLVTYATLFCFSGKISGKFNGKPQILGANDILFMPPDTVVETWEVSEDAKANFIAIPPATVIKSIYLDKSVWDRYVYLMKNPVMHISESIAEVISSFTGLAAAFRKAPRLSFDRQISQNIMEAVIYELLNIAGNDGMSMPGASSRADSLFIDFMKIAVERHGRMRKVSEIAGILCVTPKYLCKAVNSISGSSPMAWLNVITARQAAFDLKYTSKSVKEIAAELGFANISSFGSYIRKHLGCSPLQFRSRQ
jgi:AraC family transcriptional activator of pobA